MSEIKSAGVKDLWKISYPMMINFFSMMSMIFVDRLFLSRFSANSLNASVQSGTLAWSIILGWLTMASMSEVFVAQFNGAKKYDEVAKPVWQMIWLTLASWVFFIPLAIYGAPLIYDPVLRPEEFYYFQILMYFGPVFSLVSAIAGFFVGRGQTHILQWMAVLGNVINIILDPIFIFGIEGYFPSMGIKGAAIATGIGTLVQAVVLFFIFIKKKYREKYKTSQFSFDKKIFYQTVRVGLPPSFLVCVEVLGWAFFYHQMASISAMHIFVASVCQSIFLLFIFFGMGLEKGAIALAGNFIGAGEYRKVPQVLFSGLKLLGIYSIFLTCCFILYPEPIMDWFITSPESVQHLSPSALTDNELDLVKFNIKVGLFCSAFLIFFENLRWVLNGILTAAGDTMFLLLSGAFNVWFVLIVPTYLFIKLPKADITYAFLIWFIYGLFSSSLILFRFLQGKWKRNHVTMPEQEAQG